MHIYHWHSKKPRYAYQIIREISIFLVKWPSHKYVMVHVFQTMALPTFLQLQTEIEEKTEN
jgi:hypothetical protein